MGYRTEDECRGCAECIHCGRDHRRHRVYFCDICKEDTEELFRHKHKQLCWDCYKTQFISKITDDMDDTLCAECGDDPEELFQVDGEWVCEDCLESMAERVELDDL